MVLMVNRNRGEHLIRRFVGRGNKPDPRDVKIASLKQRIQELKSKEVNPFGGGNPGFHDDHYDNPLLTRDTESEPIIWDIWDEEEEYPFVNKYPSFQEEPMVLVEEESCPVYNTNNEEEELIPVYDTDIEDVIEEEEGFVKKGGFGGEEDNIKDIVVVANDLRSSMIPTILSVDFEEDINTKSHELILLVNHTTGKSPFEVVYGRNLITPLDLVLVVAVGQFSEEVADQSEQIKELHRSVQEHIIRHNKQYKEPADKHRKQVLYREYDLVWIHLRKELFLAGRFRKLKPRGYGPFYVLKKINDNAYKIELPSHYNVSATFNVADLSPYKRDSDDEPDLGSGLFQEGEDDADSVNERVKE
ncbi:hypothetical protein Tco_0855107 [Tanacetum coccineum]